MTSLLLSQPPESDNNQVNDSGPIADHHNIRREANDPRTYEAKNASKVDRRIANWAKLDE